MERPNFGGNLEIATHQMLEDRIEAAKILLDSVDDKDNTILVDTKANHASKAYSAIPERLYCILLDGKIVIEVRNYDLTQICMYIFNFRAELALLDII